VPLDGVSVTQVTLNLDTCPFPASPAFPATVLDRNLTITSLSPAALAAAAAAGAPLGPDENPSAASAASAAALQGPFWLDCAFLDGRFTMTPGHSVLLDSLVLINCRTVNTFGFINMQQGSTLILNNTVDHQGPPSVCVPLELIARLGAIFIRPERLPSAAGNRSQQFSAFAPAGSNWCAAAAAGQNSNSIPPLAPQLLPLLLANRTGYSICQQQAGILGDFARTEPPAPYQLRNESQGQQEPRAAVDILWRRSVLLCREPLTGPCIGGNASGTLCCCRTSRRACCVVQSLPYAV